MYLRLLLNVSNTLEANTLKTRLVNFRSALARHNGASADGVLESVPFLT